MAKRKATHLTGTTPKPSALKALAGTQRSDRTNHREPQLTPIAAGEPPDHYSDREKELWWEFAAIIDPMRVLTSSDLFAFRELVETAALVDRLRTAARSLSKEELVKPPPVFGQLATHQKILWQALARFGLTPADRQRVSTLADDTPEDVLSQFKV